MDYEERLSAVIPGGAHTYSRGKDQFPSNAPPILERGKGCHVFDPDGRRFLDYGMGLRSVTIGYADERVNRAALREIENGNNLTRPSVTELEAAELLVSLFPHVDMVKFAKNGSNATTAAIKIARAFTGRSFVCVPRQHPFFSFDDWFIGTTPMKKGVLPANTASTLLFDYNDIGSLEKLFAEHPGQIAAVLLEPATSQTPCPQECQKILAADTSCEGCPRIGQNFLQQVQQTCRRDGALFVLDETITGFRWHLKGAAHYFGVQPDLITLGKGMANGFSVAAVAGRKEIMEVGSITEAGAERTFLLSTTHGGEMAGLGAFIEVVRIYQSEDVIGHLWSYGARLRDVLLDCADAAGVATHFAVEGPAISLNYTLFDDQGATSLPLRTLFAQELAAAGVLMPWIAVSNSHGDAELEHTADAATKAMEVVARALEDGVEPLLIGPAVKPVFRRYN